MSAEALLISIRPKYADKVQSGVKTVELRKVKPRLTPGTTIFMYVSSPVKALMATCIVEKVVSAPPDELWAQVSTETGLSKEEFDEYFAGATEGYGICFHHFRSLDAPVELQSLRQIWAGFHPPQSYHYLDAHKRHQLNQWLNTYSCVHACAKF